MITSIKRSILLLIMCGVSAAGMAQTVILNENFNSITNFNTYTIPITGWTFNYCCGTYNVGAGSGDVALKMEWSGSTAGSATTPACNYTGDAILTFSHAYTATDKRGKLTVSISRKGTFKDNETISFDVNTKSDTEFTPESIKIKGVTSSTKIKFTVAAYNNNKNCIAIDDVKIVSTDGVTLLEASNNNETLSTYNGMTAHVTIRPLTGSIWNTLCLPFDVDMAAMEAALGANQDIKLRTYSSYDTTNNVMNFAPVTGSTVISAGTPFLLWLNTSVASPKFDWVTVKNTAAKTVTDNGVSFVGTYNPTNLNTDGSNLFLTKSNTLAIPGTAEGQNRIKGMRAYISLSSNKSMAPARISFVDEQPTGIRTIETAEVEAGSVPARAAVYSLSGQRLAQPKKGLNIVNGKLTLVK